MESRTLEGRIRQQWRGGFRRHMCYVGAQHHHPTWWLCQLGTVLKRVHGMSVYVRSSDQRRHRFAQDVEYHQQGSNVNCLIFDVKTRWNLAYHMSSRFSYVLVNYCFDSLLKLFFSFRFDSPIVTVVCLSDVDHLKFALSKEEWEKIGQLMKFL